MYKPRIYVVSNVAVALEEVLGVLQGLDGSVYDVVAFGDVQQARDALASARADAVLLLLRGTPEQCLEVCLGLQADIAPRGTPLGVIFPSTDPAVWQRIYESGAHMFLPWHGAVIQGLPTYVASLLGRWGGSSPADEPAPDSRIILDEGRRCVDIRGADIRQWHADFTPVQFRILHHLVENKGRLVTKDELARVLTRGLGQGPTEAAAALYQHISQIRKKLGPHAGIVRCIRSRGYILDDSFVAA